MRRRGARGPTRRCPAARPGGAPGHRRARYTALKFASGAGAGHRSEAPAADCPLNWRPSSRPPPDSKAQDIPVAPAMPSHAHANDSAFLAARVLVRSNVNTLFRGTSTHVSDQGLWPMDVGPYVLAGPEMSPLDFETA